jgi:hypothetical protein
MARIKEITALTGVSFESEGVWYKTQYTETVIIDEKDLKEDPEASFIKEQLWERVNDEVHKQVEELKD